MQLDLTKGQKADLTKTNPGLNALNLGLGWDVSGSSSAFDLDAAALVLRKENPTAPAKLAKVEDLVYFRNLKLTNESVKHSGDNLTGQGDGDDETITVALAKVDEDVDQIVFAVNIFEANTRRQNLGMVQNAFIRVVDASTGTEIMRYDLSEDFSSETGVEMGRLYRHSGEWKFEALGKGFVGSLQDLVTKYSA